MARPSSTQAVARPRKVWWLIGTVVLMACVLLQMPASWLVAKLTPNTTFLQHVSGNVWQGSGVMTLPSKTATPISGQVTWGLKPLSVFMGRLGADVDVVSGQTRLEGQVSRGLNGWQVQDLSGKIDKTTLAQLVSWQLPDAPIQVNAVSLALNKTSEDEPATFNDVDGQLTWAGGDFGYPSGGKTYNINLPAMRAELSDEMQGEQSVLHASLVDNDSKRLGDFYVDGDGMLDANLTQRLLENMPEYKGSAPPDTNVVSVRQPLLSGMGGSSSSNQSMGSQTMGNN